MTIFGKIIQIMLGETEEKIKNEKRDEFIIITEEDKNLNFKNYDDDLKPKSIENEEEDDDDDTNYRDKDEEQKKEYIEKIKKKAKKKIAKDNDYIKTSERNLDREIGGAEIDYELLKQQELQYRSNKRKKYRKNSFLKGQKNRRTKRLEKLRSLSLSMGKKLMKINMIKKTFKKLLSKKQLKTILKLASKNINISVKKIKKMIKKNKKVKLRATLTMNLQEQKWRNKINEQQQTRQHINRRNVNQISM